MLTAKTPRKSVFLVNQELFDCLSGLLWPNAWPSGNGLLWWLSTDVARSSNLFGNKIQTYLAQLLIITHIYLPPYRRHPVSA